MIFFGNYGNRRGFRRGGSKLRLIIALIIAGFSLLTYYGSSEHNPITGKEQRVAITPDQEIALGLQAVPEMTKQFGGLDPDRKAQAVLDAVGERLISNSAARDTGWKYDFHLLADPKTINAFALPGGQVFITRGLFSKLSTEGQLAGVLGHEIGHVVARHGAQHLAKQQLTQGLAGAAGVAAGDQGTARMAMMVGQMVNMKYGREDELESDRLGVRFMAESGYDPRSMLQVMKVLAEAGGGGRQPEFFSTHPNPENRMARIQQAIQDHYPQGVPENMEK